MQKVASTRQWFLSTLWPFWWSIAQLIGVGLLLALVSAVLPVLWQRIIDASIAGNATHLLLYLYIPLSFLTEIPVRFILRERLIDRYIQQMRQSIFEHSLHLDTAFYERLDSTVIITQLAKGIASSSRLLLICSSGDLLIDIPLAFFAAYYIGSYSSVAVALLVLFLLVFATLARMFGARLAGIERQYQTIDTALGATQREAIFNVATVRSHNAAGLITGRTKQEGLRALGLQNKQTWFYSLFFMLGQGGRQVASAIILVTFLPKLSSGSISVGTFMALTMYAGYFVSPAEFLGTSYATIKQAWANIVPLHTIVQAEPKVIESSNPLTLQPVRSAIEFQGISFSYEGGVQGVLDNFNLCIAAGTTVALVGRSGAGKTTVGRLLMRLYDPTAGVVRYDGTDVRHMSRASISEQISYLSQDVPIFSGTIAQNVGYGRAHYTDDEVIAALRKAAADFVFDLEFGINTEIGESGKRLSGGQQQRIVIARLFMGNPSVLILDEATSALDTKTEREITATFDSLSKSKTVVIIAHRLSTIKRADQIVVLDSGRVVAKGTHEQLQTCCPLYQELCGELAAAA